MIFAFIAVVAWALFVGLFVARDLYLNQPQDVRERQWDAPFCTDVVFPFHDTPSSQSEEYNHAA